MRLLLVKRGSGLPLYLHLVTDYLRLFTLYEQVGYSCPLPLASSGCVPHACLSGSHFGCMSPLLQGCRSGGSLGQLVTLHLQARGEEL